MGDLATLPTFAAGPTSYTHTDFNAIFAGLTIGTGKVVTNHLANKAVTMAKIEDIATDNLIGRSTIGTGVPELIPLTAAGRALLDDASADAQLATLGGGAAGIAVFKASSKATGRAALDLDTSHRPKFLGLDIEGSAGRIDFTDTASTANKKRARIVVSTDQFRFQRLLDDDTPIDSFLVNEVGDIIIAENRRLRLGSSYVNIAPTITGYLLMEDKNGNLYQIGARLHS